ncbi:MAG TPA: sigma-70 family RNA polymerase sigma factor [Terrimicrobiaceae bacterium]|nr:sigma-70 family RNA polymerase sigma factor [Terrimicrobiaceae bacterium]
MRHRRMGDDPEEANLLERARRGDTAAFDSLITLYRERIHMHVFQIARNQEDALDLTQETFIRAWKSLARFDAAAPFASWLHRIATNAAIDLCRRRQVRPQVEIGSGALKVDPASRTTPSRPETPGTSLDRAEIKRRVEEAFQGLTPEHRAVIVLKEIEDFSYEEIARHLGCSTGTVMSRLFYARKKLQTLLRDLHEEL